MGLPKGLNHSSRFGSFGLSPPFYWRDFSTKLWPSL
jgi:hypothetical protein